MGPQYSVVVWAGIDLIWHIVHIVIIAVIHLVTSEQLGVTFWWLYLEIVLYPIMIIVDILVFFGAMLDVRVSQAFRLETYSKSLIRISPLPRARAS